MSEFYNYTLGADYTCVFVLKPHFRMKMINVYTAVSETISVYTTETKTHVTWPFMQVQP